MSACIDRIVVNKCECSDEDKNCCATGFAPIGDVSKNGDEIIINHSCKLLILGTFPGKDSLDKGEYYFNPRNSFRGLVFEKYNQGYSEDYNAFIKLLEEHNIVLWDAFKKCKRRTALDKDIECALLNDFSNLPDGIVVVFNGKLSGRNKKIKKQLEEKIKFEIRYLYSTSNSCTNPDKRREWLDILP